MNLDQNYPGQTEGQRDLERYMNAPGAVPMQQVWDPYGNHGSSDGLGSAAYGVGAGSTDYTHRPDSDYSKLSLPQDILDRQQAAEAAMNMGAPPPGGTMPAVSQAPSMRAPGIEGVVRTGTASPMMQGSIQSSSLTNEMRGVPAWQPYRLAPTPLTGTSSKEDVVLKLVSVETRTSALETAMTDVHRKLDGGAINTIVETALAKQRATFEDVLLKDRATRIEVMEAGGDDGDSDDESEDSDEVVEVVASKEMVKSAKISELIRKGFERLLGTSSLAHRATIPEFPASYNRDQQEFVMGSKTVHQLRFDWSQDYRADVNREGLDEIYTYCSEHADDLSSGSGTVVAHVNEADLRAKIRDKYKRTRTTFINEGPGAKNDPDAKDATKPAAKTSVSELDNRRKGKRDLRLRKVGVAHNHPTLAYVAQSPYCNVVILAMTSDDETAYDKDGKVRKGVFESQTMMCRSEKANKTVRDIDSIPYEPPQNYYERVRGPDKDQPLKRHRKIEECPSRWMVKESYLKEHPEQDNNSYVVDDDFGTGITAEQAQQAVAHTKEKKAVKKRKAESVMGGELAVKKAPKGSGVNKKRKVKAETPSVAGPSQPATTSAGVGTNAQASSSRERKDSW